MKKLILPLVVLFGLAGCSNMNPTEQRLLTGTTGGAAGGAIIGALAGHAGAGALIGAGAGLAGGFLYDQWRKSESRAYQSGYAQGQASRGY